MPVEDTDAAAGASEIPATVAIRAATRRGANVRLPGTDVVAGAALLDRGRACDPAAIALLAATGHATVTVHRRPRVAVISTGDELVPPGQPLGPAQIHDSNSYALAAQAAEAGAEVRRLGVARDTLPDLLALVREGVAWADVVVLSGGVSVGAHDHVKAAFSDVGTLDVWRVAIKPGRPFAFARATVDGRPRPPLRAAREPGQRLRHVRAVRAARPAPARRPCAGLRPAGAHRPPGRADARVVRPARRSPASSWRPTRIARTGCVARSSGGQDSYMLASLAVANGMLFIPPDVDLPAGAEAVAWVLRGHEA